MKLNELKITALPRGSEIKSTPIEPEMDLEFKTDLKQTPKFQIGKGDFGDKSVAVGREHTLTNPDPRQELSPDEKKWPQGPYNKWRDEQFAPKPESEWSDKPNKYVQKIIDLRNKGIDAVKGFAGDVKDKFLNWRGVGQDSSEPYAYGEMLPSLKDLGSIDFPAEIKKRARGAWDHAQRRYGELTGESMENLKRMKTLAGLKESGDLPGEDVWAYSPRGEGGTVARVVKTDHGFQVYVMGPYGWIAQGQPHMSQEEAQEDAMSFFEAVAMVDSNKLNEENINEILSALELHEEQLTEEETNEHEIVSVLPESKLTEGWGSIAKWLGLGGIIASGGKAIQDFTTGAKEKVKKGTSRTQQALDNAGVGNKKTVTNSADPQPWWRDMTTTLQEMKAEMMENPKKK